MYCVLWYSSQLCYVSTKQTLLQNTEWKEKEHDDTKNIILYHFKLFSMYAKFHHNHRFQGHRVCQFFID
jgi:hypothetical protein